MNGDLVGRLRHNGTSLDRGPYRERAGLDERIEEAGQDVAGVRRMLASAGAVLS